MTWKYTFFVVTGCALAGMTMGGLFGLAAGEIAPGFFQHVIPWQDVEPVGFAAFIGATAGVLLGGGLGCFAVTLHFISQWKKPDYTTLGR